MTNSVVLSGNLGSDPEIRQSNAGNSFCNFSLAFKTKSKGQDGKYKTGWIRVTAFGKLAELAEKYLFKGSKVVISGNLDYNQYEDKNGNKRSDVTFIANDFDFMDKKESSGNYQNTNNNSRQQSQSNQYEMDDVPF